MMPRTITPKPLWKRLAMGLLAFAGALAILLLLMAYVPFTPLRYEPAAPLGYAESVRKIRAIIAAEPANILPVARPVLLDHGAPTERVFVLLHGLSNCPAQFSQLSEKLYRQGCNVLIPRMPYHGEINRMNTEWGRLTAQEMLDECNRAADLAKGIGKRVTIIGLSINATTAAWMAQNRGDLDQAVLLSPFLAPKGVPLWGAGPLSRLLVRLPNYFIWWDPVLKEHMRGPEYCYPRFPTRVIGQVMRLGEDVLVESRENPPLCGNILVVRTASDQAVNNEVSELLVQQWKASRPGAIRTYTFPKEEKVPHDFIDPNQPDQQIAIAYPKLMTLLFGETGADSAARAEN